MMSTPAVDCAAERPLSTPHLAVNASGLPPNPVPAPASVRTIPVFNGPDALCDEEDFPFLSQFNWHLNRRGFTACTIVGGKWIYMHQFVLLSETSRRVNHRDGNAFNNCRSNLRVASHMQVEATKPKSQKRLFSSIYKGVHRRKSETRWRAKVSVGGLIRCLGVFETQEAAACAYDAAAREAFGEFAYQNLAASEPSQPASTAVSSAAGSLPLLTAAVEFDAKPGAARTIPVTGGPGALCDEKDFALLSRFHWRVKRRGNLDCPVTYICGKPLYMHYLVIKSPFARKVTHRDGNAFNNCLANLNISHSSEVQAARGKRSQPGLTSRYKGVCKPKNRKGWYAEIRIRGVLRKLGRFTDEEAAARAYDAVAREALGEIAYLNFPEH